jgi:HD-GYP domain-containing protein (c-di-GMP phosphodiesterase class II)
MAEHPVAGERILLRIPDLTVIAPVVRHEHEHWDGSGYPDRLAGEQIPLGARILCAAEIYDALTTARPYQEKMTPERAVERMQELAGTILDPRVLHALLAVVSRRRALVFIDETTP